MWSTRKWHRKKIISHGAHIKNIEKQSYYDGPNIEVY